MKTIFTSLLIITISCSTPQNDVGDIAFDPNIDDSSFKVCDESQIEQYYVRNSSDTRPSYNGEKKALRTEIMSNYNYPQNEQQNGYLTIRFIVNCHGESGRFRTEEMNFEFQPIEFDKQISNQLLSIVSKLRGWIPRKRRRKTLDIYQYMTFRIENGQITEILP